MSLKVNICGIEFNNPVIAASGTFGFGKEFADYIDINKLGGISSKGLTLHKNLGNCCWNYEFNWTTKSWN